MRALNTNKAHSHDEISMRMIEICDEALVKPLSLMYKNCINTAIVPSIWKKSNIVPQPLQLRKKFDSKFWPSIFASSKAFPCQKFSCLFLLAACVHD